MTLILSGTDGLSDVDGSAATPAIRGTDANTGIFFPAADTIAFSEGGVESMRIDSSGNVGIGTTDTSLFNSVGGSTRLAVCGSSASTDILGNTGASISIINTDTTANNTAGLHFARADTDDTPNYAGASIVAQFPDTQVASQYPKGLLAFLTSTTANAAPSEKMRIDSSGNLLVGNASQVWDERLSARNSTNTVVAGFYAQSTSYTSSVIRAQAETAAGTGWYLFEGRSSAGTFQYGIRGNGTVATSDERRKKNVEPARSYLADVCSIPVVKYNWKTDSDDAPKELGWLAQDVAKVFPNMVVTHHDGPNDDQEVLLLKKEVFLPMLMKCIQELKAEVDQLRAQLEAR